MKSTSFASVLMPAVLCAVCFAGCQSTPVNPVRGKAFVWNQDARWEAYEQAFLAARAQGCPKNAAAVEAGFAQISALLLALGDSAAVDDADLDRLERAVFDTAPLVAVCRERLPSFQALQMKLVAATKGWSAGWDLSSPVDRARLYRLVYGSRAALEEAILQGPLDDADVLVHGTAIQHANVPSALVHGVRIESGDILLSRGGAAASALIARGNDFPGYFSHVALVHVDERGVPTVVEAHIEKGVVPTDPEGYLTDKKLRIQVLRHRARGAGDSLLPHRAASHALLDANSRHIPYDFAMDWQRHDRMFCSEVVFAAYESQGIDLWTGMSTISSPGLVRWLSEIGVRHFETHEPSDLTYDPQLDVVAEWADPETLWKDHIDNAVTDVMLEGAEQGDELTYALWKLPLAGAAKAYSWMRNKMGAVGPIPEGMSARTALRMQAFAARHAELAARVRERAEAAQALNGYRPPYWDLIALAREVRNSAP